MFWRRKTVILQMRDALKNRDINELERELSTKFKCKVIILPSCLMPEIKMI